MNAPKAASQQALELADRVRALDRQHAGEAYEDHDLVSPGRLDAAFDR